ncbi:putative intraflagellar transport particle protein [Neospora caninum Liverpool]|uniref:Putative intraflagellar transport particle protein n=1 Tax=Neospora caninum (strain Liverpool) TaxID=572307 RepID=F0V7S1_NEOCL|nr:putative intraflagellar transport particle protein [Neospora caninum Liverpool]CBZ49762.1 putative intraflagellar transport particle protein [Neospora caninum Liverpool]|eukprot:XP_003879797.1 putative intraflagellar transport particle protein [Neospora caninum Liverpool]
MGCTGNPPDRIGDWIVCTAPLKTNSNLLRCKLLKTIGDAYFLAGKFPEATATYEQLLKVRAQLGWSVSAFLPRGHRGPRRCVSIESESLNLLLCYYAAGNKEKMQEHFLRMIVLQDNVPGADEAAENEDDDEELSPAMSPLSTSALSPSFCGAPSCWACPDFSPKHDARSSSTPENTSNEGYRDLAYEIEMHKAAALLRVKCGVDAAVKIYRSFERVERQHAVLTPRAATNLSFIYLLEDDLSQATKYTDIALAGDRYNAFALVNKGCCLLLGGKRQEARNLFLEALGLDAECVEALYNFGLACKLDAQFEEALKAFSRFHQIFPRHPEVLYHLGDISEAMGHSEKAVEWFSLLTSPGVRPTDAGILGRIGRAAASRAEDDQALHHFLSSYSYYHCSLDVITWLGVYYVKQRLFDKAAEFFRHAAALQPAEPKWLLMAASCYRRSDNFPRALDLYTKVHQENPADVECLRCLVTVCKELGIPYDHYAAMLRRAEHAEVKGQNGLQVGSLSTGDERPLSTLLRDMKEHVERPKEQRQRQQL